MLQLTEKKDIVQSLVETFSKAESVIVSDYVGLTVPEVTQLRKSLSQSGVRAQVVKNRLANLALKNYNCEFPDQMLKGMSMFFSTESDVAGLSKKLVDFSVSRGNFSIKGGFLNGSFIDSAQIDQLAKLPSRDVLIAKVVGQIKAPLSGFVATLANPINSFINVLNNIKNKKQEVTL